MLRIENLNQYYGESHTLWDVALNIEAGSRVCLMGRNGMGKTTLLQCIMGLLPIKTGSIEFENQNITHQPAELRAKLGVGFVPQGRQIFSQLSVEENLMIGLNARRDKLRKIPERIFDLFPVLKDMLQRRGGDLSGGQQQQLAIGRALVLDPKLLILDEPCEGIQPNIVQQIGDVLLTLNEEENVTILLVEQKLPFARRVGQQFTIMDKGRSVASGPMQNLSEQLIQKHLTV
ncbi:MAG: urea ABC transporter ATP-binding subunit UrtE [Gammaproteobacteria bacterium]|jgi:urea transport system ATP-binding protein|nr:urea ABC transporter ATP-binding subunit UrtE [Gammaproteobacteria bacterium]